jgi:hypothetical protein
MLLEDTVCADSSLQGPLYEQSICLQLYLSIVLPPRVDCQNIWDTAVLILVHFPSFLFICLNAS